MYLNSASAQNSVLVGHWECFISNGYTMALDLKPDGSGIFDSDPITYKIGKDTLTLFEPGGVTNRYSFSIVNGKLLLSGGDLDKQLTLSKIDISSEPESNMQKKSSTDADISSIIGTWTGQTGTFVFAEGGTGTANGAAMQYSIAGNNLTMQDNVNTYQFTYLINGNTLTITASGRSVTFNRGTVAAPNTAVAGNSTAGNGKGMELVGKWCYLTSNYNSLYSQSNSSSTDECFVLDANGTYTYHFESSRGASGNYGYAGTSSQNDDAGTWAYDGVSKLTVNSNTAGQKVYTIEKKNHPKNKDPMIFIDGKGFVTFYNKAPW